MHPHFSSHIVPNPSLHSLTTMSLVKPSFSQLFQLPEPKVIGNRCLNAWHDYAATVALNYHILNLHINTHPILKKISQHPINQSHFTHHPDHIMLHPTQTRLIHNSEFPNFTTVQQNWSSTTLINLPLLFQR